MRAHRRARNIAVAHRRHLRHHRYRDAHEWSTSKDVGAPERRLATFAILADRHEWDTASAGGFTVQNPRTTRSASTARTACLATLPVVHCTTRNGRGRAHSRSVIVLSPTS